MLTHRLYLRHIEDTELAQQQRIATAEREAADAARHLAELQKSESRFQKAFAHAAIGMALVTHDRLVLQANPALCEILARSEEELLGRGLRRVRSSRRSHRAIGGAREPAFGLHRHVLDRASMYAARSRRRHRRR